jgi:hypothetical protein
MRQRFGMHRFEALSHAEKPYVSCRRQTVVCFHRFSNNLLEIWLHKWRPVIGVEGLARIVKAKVAGTAVPPIAISPAMGTPTALVVHASRRPLLQEKAS